MPEPHAGKCPGCSKPIAADAVGGYCRPCVLSALDIVKDIASEGIDENATAQVWRFVTLSRRVSGILKGIPASFYQCADCRAWVDPNSGHSCTD